MSQSIPNQKTSKLAERSEVFKAIVREDIPRLRQLLRVPNNVNAINKAGETCLDIALARKKRAAEKLIRECGGLTSVALAERHGREAPATSLMAAAARSQYVHRIPKNIRMRLLQATLMMRHTSTASRRRRPVMD